MMCIFGVSLSAYLATGGVSFMLYRRKSRGRAQLTLPSYCFFIFICTPACLLLELICPIVTTAGHSQLHDITSITCLPKGTVTCTCCEHWKNAPKLNWIICWWRSLTDGESGPYLPLYTFFFHGVEVSIWSWQESRHLVSSHYPRSAHPHTNYFAPLELTSPSTGHHLRNETWVSWTKEAIGQIAVL
jgi:hypothetical protein